MFVSKIVGFNKFSIYGSSILLRHLLDKQKTPQSNDYGVTVVDDTRLELVTSRTSSGCATSCANEHCAL